MEERIEALERYAKSAEAAILELGDKFNGLLKYNDFLEAEIKRAQLMISFLRGDIDAITVAVEAICAFHGENSPLGSAIKARLAREDAERDATITNVDQHGAFQAANEQLQLALAGEAWKPPI